jgi:hypothetical protein
VRPALASLYFCNTFSAGAAIALANLDIFEREGINEHVRSLEVRGSLLKTENPLLF